MNAALGEGNRGKSKLRVAAAVQSELYREILQLALSGDVRLQLAGTAGDAAEAARLVKRLQPEALVCDVAIYRLLSPSTAEGKQTRRLMVVALCASVSEKAEASRLGADVALVRPDPGSVAEVRAFVGRLLAALHTLLQQGGEAAPGGAGARPGTPHRQPSFFPSEATGGENRKSGKLPDEQKVIAIGASTGGTGALLSLLAQLPADLPGLLIVLHIPPVFSRLYAERLNEAVPMSVKEARNGDRLLPGTALLAPGDKHMRLRRTEEGYRVSCSSGVKVNGHCPSVDVLFESVAESAKEGAIGVLLTGMGADGANGLLQMRRMGARTIGQDEASSIVYGMPRAGYEIGAVERQASLADMPDLIMRLLRQH